MFKLRLITALVALSAASMANAQIDLIAIGSINGNYQDLAKETAGKLENGVAGNILGGMGSGLAHANGNTFLALPDRGPNANAYNANVDETTSYIPRFHTVNLSLAPSPAGSALPYTLSPHLTATTLFATGANLYYGSGAGTGVGTTSGTDLPNGAPALNAVNGKRYFSGRSDNFRTGTAGQFTSTYALNGRLDPEGIRVSNDGKFVYISDEYGPYLYKFNRVNGMLTQRITLPAKFAASSLSAIGNNEITGNTSGRVANKGMEGLAISPDGSTLFGVMQSPLIQDGGTSGKYTRIVKVDTATGTVLAEYAYPLDNIGTVASPKYLTVSEIVAINNNEFLVDERDGKGLGDNSNAVHKKLYRINLSTASDVSSLSGEASLSSAAISKTLFLDVVAALTAKGFAAQDIPAKLEGVSFGEDITIGGVNKHTLYIANDNDFIATVTDSKHPAGIDNANKFFVFAVDEADLAGFTAQTVTPLTRPVKE